MRVTTIAILKGGTGKSTTAAFLAHALAGPLFDVCRGQTGTEGADRRA
jgi:cellulose biosynthesis protein BcsQ